ncbi:MAG: hypothetical protein CTY37_05595 [Methylotenera sp.]|nr:MAG: hypothetical protein BVN34_05400 [Proteobacteria bacterium ST_bin12]PPC86552.1 MAG: hypothetical protein CTY37_05595 [Methylotenera sp.]
MNNQNVYAVYAEFLVQCRRVMGPFDIEKLASDEAYKVDFFNRVMLSEDDQLFKMADLVNRALTEEARSVH